jgi:phage protein D
MPEVGNDPCAERSSSPCARTQAYWAAKHADDIVTIARESRAFATAVATAAKAAQFDRATEAAAKMGARCNACHDLHPEKR